jgi:hypothetical protein
MCISANPCSFKALKVGTNQFVHSTLMAMLAEHRNVAESILYAQENKLESGVIWWHALNKVLLNRNREVCNVALPRGLPIIAAPGFLSPPTNLFILHTTEWNARSNAAVFVFRVLLVFVAN